MMLWASSSTSSVASLPGSPSGPGTGGQSAISDWISSFISFSRSSHQSDGGPDGASGISSPGIGVVPPRPRRCCGVRQPAGPHFSITSRKNLIVLPVDTELVFFFLVGQSEPDVGPMTDPSAAKTAPPESPGVAESYVARWLIQSIVPDPSPRYPVTFPGFDSACRLMPG